MAPYMDYFVNVFLFVLRSSLEEINYKTSSNYLSSWPKNCQKGLLVVRANSSAIIICVATVSYSELQFVRRVLECQHKITIGMWSLIKENWYFQGKWQLL